MEKYKKTGGYGFFYEGREQRGPITQKRKIHGEHNLIHNCTKILPPCFYKESFLDIYMDVDNKAGSEDFQGHRRSRQI